MSVMSSMPIAFPRSCKSTPLLCRFFGNIGAICTLAFAGTAVSTAVIAAFMWLVGAAGLAYNISFFHACVFGAIISATDPVTVLAVFGATPLVLWFCDLQ